MQRLALSSMLLLPICLAIGGVALAQDSPPGSLDGVRLAFPGPGGEWKDWEIATDPAPCSDLDPYHALETYACRRNPLVPNHCEGQYYMGTHNKCNGIPMHVGYICIERAKECWQRYWGLWNEETQTCGPCDTYQYGALATKEAETKPWDGPHL